MYYFIYILLLVFILNLQTFPSNANNFEKEISLIDLYKACLENNPQLKYILWDKNINEGLINQSKFYNNPLFSSSVENLGKDDLELNIQLSQKLFFDSKRNNIIKFTETNRDITEKSILVKRNELKYQVSISFSNFLYLYNKLNIIQEVKSEFEKAYFIVNELVKIGKESPVELSKAKANLNNIEIELENTKKSLQLSILEISTLTGLSFESLNNIDHQNNIIKFEDIYYFLNNITNNPSIFLLNSYKNQQIIKIKTEELEVLPDITVSGGYRISNFNTGNISSFLAGFSFNLPAFDTNSGNIESEKYRLSKINTQILSLINQIKLEVINEYKNYYNSGNKAKKIQTTIFPENKKVLNSALEGYKLGKFNYLYVIDAQTRFLNSKVDFIEALRQFHNSGFFLDKLTGSEIHAKLFRRGL